MNCLGQSLPSEESFQWWQILFATTDFLISFCGDIEKMVVKMIFQYHFVVI